MTLEALDSELLPFKVSLELLVLPLEILRYEVRVMVGSSLILDNSFEIRILLPLEVQLLAESTGLHF